MNSAWSSHSSLFHLSRPLFLLLATHNYQQHTSHHCQFPIGLGHTKVDPDWLLSRPDVLSAHWWLAEADVWRRDWWSPERGGSLFLWLGCRGIEEDLCACCDPYGNTLFTTLNAFALRSKISASILSDYGYQTFAWTSFLCTWTLLMFL